MSERLYLAVGDGGVALVVVLEGELPHRRGGVGVIASILSTRRAAGTLQRQ